MDNVGYILNTGLNYYADNKIVGPARATVFINLIPVFGIILATSLLDEHFLQSHAMGAICIIIGVICVIKNRLLSH
jgi:drug/metabolite transporter (DMT)-like permease